MIPAVQKTPTHRLIDRAWDAVVSRPIEWWARSPLSTGWENTGAYVFVLAAVIALVVYALAAGGDVHAYSCYGCP